MDKLETETNLGTLFAERTGGNEYPGFWIGLKRGDNEIEFMLVEADQSDVNKPVLHIREWPIDREGVWDEPTHETDATAEQVKEMFAREE